MRYALAALIVLVLTAGCSEARPAWRERPPAPEARSEVAAVNLSGRVAVIGGLTADGAPSGRVDLFDPTRERWLRLPDLPEPVHHPMAASRADRLYVFGGYRVGPSGHEASDRAWVLFDRRWRPLPRLPEARAAGGAARVRNRIYVVGGVSGAGLARRSLYLDLRTLRWGDFPGLERPREHLGVTALAGRVYAVGGRTAGLDSNLAAADAYDPVRRRWTRLPAPPVARGGNGAAVVDRLVVAVGGETPDGTIREVDAFDPATRAWRRLTPSSQPRHGVGAVGVGRTLYQALGGPRPGLTVSPTLLSLRVRR